MAKPRFPHVTDSNANNAGFTNITAVTHKVVGGHSDINKACLKKRCPRCEKEFPATTDYFQRLKRNKDGLYYYCKACSVKVNAANYAKRKDKARVYRKEYNAKNRVEIAGKRRAYRETNKEKIREDRAAAYLKNSDAVKKKRKEYYEKNKSTILARTNSSERERLRRITHQKSKAKFKTYAPKLVGYDAECDENGFLLTRCTNSNCGKWFNPSVREVTGRIAAMNGKKSLGSEYNLYCSQECKSSCDSYGKQAATLIKRDEISSGAYGEHRHEKFYSTTELKTWAVRVKSLARWSCEICGSTDNLVAHHIEPKSISPEAALDPANGVCLCGCCHKEFGHSSRECKTSYLRKCNPVKGEL